jgi:SAM-dependent methyltransferase
MSPETEAPGPPYDEEYYRETYGRELTRRLPHLTREQYWAHWLKRRLRPGQDPIVDLGSGLGWLALRARAQGLAPVSLDISEFSAQRLRDVHSLPVIVGSATRVPVRPGSIAAVVALDVLEHVDDPRVALSEIRGALRPEGLIVISVPNTQGYGARRKHGTGTWFGDRDHTHLALWSPDQWVRALIDSGYVIERKGSDLLWDVPYPVRVPEPVQRAILIPLHRLVSRVVGALHWSAGENLVLVGRAS